MTKQTTIVVIGALRVNAYVSSEDPDEHVPNATVKLHGVQLK